MNESINHEAVYRTAPATPGLLTSQLKRIIIQCKISYMRKTYFYFKNVLLNTINNISMLLEIIIIKFSCILKMMSRNTFPEPQPDSAS